MDNKLSHRIQRLGVALLGLGWLLLGVGCGQAGAVNTPDAGAAARMQLSIGYSLLYQEAEGIPKLKWLLMFKDKPDELSRTVDGLLAYYEELAEAMQRLSTQYPALRIDVAPMSAIEGEMRKAIGADQARDFAPIVGVSGVPFERELLLMFYNALDEQRHLAGVMIERETDPGLKAFLLKTREQLEARRRKVETLLNRRYFVH